jgi:hypothetical protein
MTHTRPIVRGRQPSPLSRNAFREAMTALTTHSQACEQCVDDHTLCPTGVGLVRAVREARR